MKITTHLVALLSLALAGQSAANSEQLAQQNIPEQDDACAINPKAIVSDACASYQTLENMNHALSPLLTSLTRNNDFFAYYRLNLFNKACPFWNDEDAMCGNIACAVNTIDDEESIPPIWRMEELSKLEGPKAGHPGPKQRKERTRERPLVGMLGKDTKESCVVEYDDECDERDYCVPEDESATGKGDYVSLVDNPERYTGYIGPSANQVWDAIYRENCFKRDSFTASKSASPADGMSLPAAKDLKFVLQGGTKHEPKIENAPSAETGYENTDECLEKRVFYRVVSGMHASISAHICWNNLNKTTGEWGPDLECYKYRLHKHPERIANLYFNYALVTRAVAKLGPYLDNYTFCLGDAAQDRETKEKVLEITATAANEPEIFDESVMFVNGEGPSLKEDFRNRFRNVSRLMDCVGCDKCRLWGKLQTQGYGTALKVLFEFDNPNAKGEIVPRPQLRRTEVVALFNTLTRISTSLSAVEKFREMIEIEESGGKMRSGTHYHKDSQKVAEDLDNLEVPDKAIHVEDVKPLADDDAANAAQAKKEKKEREDINEVIRQTMSKRDTRNETIGEALRNEIGLVWRVVKWIFRQWVEFPGTVWYIIRNEASIAWNSYIGLKPPARTWGWRVESPSDEL